MVSWYPVGGNGGLPSDMLTSDKEYSRRLKVSNESSLSTSSFLGLAYSCSASITIPAGEDVSFNLNSNASFLVSKVRAKGAEIEYYKGSASGEFISTCGFESLNGNLNLGYQAGIDFYNGHPTGERVINNVDEISEAFYPNGSFCVEITNTSSEDKTFFVSVVIEFLSDPILPHGFYAGLELDGNLEVGDYNG